MNFSTCVGIPLRASYTRRPLFLVQKCRSFSLMKEVFGKKPPAEVNMISQFVPFNSFTPPDKNIINLQYGAAPVPINEQMTLQSAVKFHIKPGKLLSPSESSIADIEYPQYKIESITTAQLQTHALSMRGEGRWKSRVFKLSPSTPQHQFIELMAAMWRLLKERQSVEVQVTILDARIWGKTYPFAQMFQNYLHLRPDVLLKAMPPDCGITVDPQTDNKIVAWIMNPPYIHKNGKVYPPNKAIEKLNERKDEAMEKEIILDEKATRIVRSIYTRTPERASLQLEENNKAVDWRALERAVQKSRKRRQRLEAELKERKRLRKLREMSRNHVQQGPSHDE